MLSRTPFVVTLGLVVAVAAGCRTTPDASIDTVSAGAEPTRITLLFAADLHGYLEPHPELFWRDGQERTEIAGGFARLGAVIDRVRAEPGGHVLAIDGGDTIQGGGPATFSEGAAIVPALDAIGFDLGVPGNWEVVYGPEVLKQRAKELRHPLVAANVRDAATGERLFPPYVVRELGGVKVAVIGYTDPDVPLRQPPAYSRGLRYDGPEELPALVREVREKGADVVVLLSHIGLAKAVDLAGRLEGVDIHLSSDTHERTYEPIERNGAWIVEPGSFGSFLGRLDLFVQDGRIVERKWNLLELTASAFPEEDPEIRAIVDRSVEPWRAQLAQVVGRTDVELARYAVVETTLDNLLADALRDTTGTEIALSNGFRFGTPIPAGPIREADLWNFYPVVTNLKTGRVTGRQLRAFWEKELENVFAKDAAKRFGGWVPRPSGMTVRFVADAPPGQRVRELRVNGELLDDDRLYTITACEREGDAEDTVCRIPKVRDVRVHSVDAHDAVRRFLAKHPDVAPRLEGRVVGLDLPPVLRSQF